MQSTDETAEIARRFEKVQVLSISAEVFDERKNRGLLIDAARQVGGPRVLLAIDADEFLTPNWERPEWRQALQSEPGTLLTFDWVNLLPGIRRAWVPPHKIPYGFVDDGSDHSLTPIHGPRIPIPDGAPICALSETKVLHLQYTDWPRMKSKQRWYQCWERINHPRKRPIQIYRQYHRMDAFPPDQLHPVPPDWLHHYAELGIDLRPRSSAGPFWWDEQVLEWLVDRGPRPFAKIADVWDEDWGQIAARLGRTVPPERVSDPRGRLDRLIHQWLSRTQSTAMSSTTRWWQRALIPFGW